jgi:hypothetical protein
MAAPIHTKSAFKIHIKSDYTDTDVTTDSTSKVGALFAADPKLLEVTFRREAPERPLGFVLTTFVRVDE